MTFSFVAAGTRNQVVESLDMLTDKQLGYDLFGSQIRDAIVDAISIGTELEPPSGQRYQVHASGHSGKNSAVILTAEIKLVPVAESVSPETTEVPACGA